MIVSKSFYFEAAHSIPNHIKCGAVHGHSYRIDIICEGTIKITTGMVIDFSDIKKAVTEKVLDKLDHQYLNNIEGLELPTAEILCQWIAQRLIDKLPLHTVRVWETKDAFAELQLK